MLIQLLKFFLAILIIFNSLSSCHWCEHYSLWDKYVFISNAVHLVIVTSLLEFICSFSGGNYMYVRMPVKPQTV